MLDVSYKIDPPASAIIPIENGGLSAWGRVNGAGAATYVKKLISGYRHPLEP